MVKILNAIKPNPGTQEAQDKGCTCPVMDNHYGKGRSNGDFIYNMDCPLHTAEIEIKDDGELCITTH